MELSNDEIRTGSTIVTVLAGAVAFVWRMSKVHSRLEQVEQEVQEVKSGNFMTHPDHETRQLLCRSDVDHKIDAQAQTVAQVISTQAAISGDIKELTEVVTAMDKKVAVIFAEVNKK